MLALLCFNSRFSIVLSAVVYILLNYKNMIYSRHRIKYVLCIGLTSAVFLYMLFNTSFGGRLLDLGLYGDASSMARTEILDIFQVVDYREFMFVGIPYEDIIYIQAMAGLDYLIIENPWIIFIFRYGILQTFAMILFFIPLFHKWLIPYGKFNAWVICILFLSLVSSSNSLAVGSTAIAQVYLFAFAFKNQKINMIPKTIHYCWLSDEPIPANIQKYIDGWRKVMPEYRIKNGIKRLLIFIV